MLFLSQTEMFFENQISILSHFEARQTAVFVLHLRLYLPKKILKAHSVITYNV